jgi:hypothetical protein
MRTARQHSAARIGLAVRACGILLLGIGIGAAARELGSAIRDEDLTLLRRLPEAAQAWAGNPNLLALPLAMYVLLDAPRITRMMCRRIRA